MKTYKYISVPSEIVVAKNATMESAIASALDIVNAEAMEGWELVGVAPCTLRSKQKGLRGVKVNTLIFAKEVE